MLNNINSPKKEACKNTSQTCPCQGYTSDCRSRSSTLQSPLTWSVCSVPKHYSFLEEDFLFVLGQIIYERTLVPVASLFKTSTEWHSYKSNITLLFHETIYLYRDRLKSHTQKFEKQLVTKSRCSRIDIKKNQIKVAFWLFSCFLDCLSAYLLTPVRNFSNILLGVLQFIHSKCLILYDVSIP